MKTLNQILLATLATAALSAQAQDLLITNATVHTMGEDGVLENTDILVEDGAIRRIGGDLRAPNGVAVIDANGRNVTPALFAGITTIGLAEVSAVEQSVDNEVSGLETPFMRPEFDVSLAYNPQSTLVPIARVEGFGFTVLGASPGDTIIGGQGRAARLDGDWSSTFGSRVLYISVGGNASSKSGGSRAAQWMLLEQAVTEAEDGPGRDDDPVLTRGGRATLARYIDGGTVVFSVNRASDILQVLRFANRHGMQPVIAGGAEAWMVADQLAAANAPVILNPLQNLPSNFDMLGSRLDNAALLEAAGVTVAISGAGAHNARKQRQMAGNAVSYGLSAEAGLAALTSNPARIFGLDSVGSLETGKRADLVIWSGDPLEVTTLADVVVMGGEVDSMKTRQTELRDRYLVEDPEMPRAYIR